MLGVLLKNLLFRGNLTGLARVAFDAGVAESQRGNHAAAAQHFERAISLGPENGQYHHVAGINHLKLANLREARRCFFSALALDPAIPGLYMILSQMEMPGPFYLDLLPSIHAHLRPRTYVEIGVETGQALRMVNPETLAIGIDPKPVISHALSARTAVHAVTSDEYFARHDVRAELGGMPIDLAFIDGMHHFEVALRDFINLEKHCAPSSTILIHDCYPFDRLTAERERHVEFWSGDVWRLMLALRKYRPDLRLYTVATAPTGLGIARGLDPRSRVLGERFDDIVREFLEQDYSVLDADKPGMLALYPNDLEKIRAILN
jgi:tetratricopeptide (TPR) repeat protein